MMPPCVELVATGSELLSGRSVNTHARLLAMRLRPLGLTLARETTVPDDPEAMAGAIREALARAAVVVVSGGLGPTSDDGTREAAAGALGLGLREDGETLRRLAERRAGSGLPLTPLRRRQAMVLEGAEVWQNPVGSAPGQRVAAGDAHLILLPGPPHEFEALLDTAVAPWLAAHLPAVPGAERILMTAGLPESEIAARIEGGGFARDGITVAYAASPAGVEIRFAAPAGLGEQVAALAEAVAGILDGAVYSREREDLAAVVLRRLRERGQTLATAESCTGGGLGARITAVPGSSAAYLGGVVAYANAIKTAMLGVPSALIDREGAVSAPVAEAMARGVRERFAADYGIAITGVAGPGGGTAAKPVGLVFVGLADAAASRAQALRLPFDREGNRLAAVQRALDALRRRLEGGTGDAR